jgi:excisionase family DNA binding protein
MPKQFNLDVGGQGERPGLVDTNELSELLKASRGTIDNWRKAGLIPWIQLGRSVRFDWPAVREALLRRQRGAA